jgi:DNA-binding transcriptional ArsR family regulator
VQAKVARYGEDGAGLAFLLEDDRESRRWDRLRESLIEETKPEEMLSVVRLSEAIAFLSRICPGGSKEIEQLLRVRLSKQRVANAIEIALIAQKLLVVEPASEGVRAELRLVVRILEEGSCSEEAWLRHFWAGLMATACTADGSDELSRVMVELFSQLATFPVRTLVVVCTRAAKVATESGLICAEPLACNIDEIKTITGSQRPRIERDLDQLSALGLIEKEDRNSPTLSVSDEVFITPTSLGLQLFARCNGQRGSLREFYAIDSVEQTAAASQ